VVASDKITRGVLLSSSVLILLVAGGMILSLLKGSIPAFREFGPGFILSPHWDPTAGNERYGALPFITGTLVSSILALAICLPLSMSTSLFVAEYFDGSGWSKVISTMTDLLAGIPSIVYGLWGFYALRPVIVSLGLSDQGFGLFTSSIILAIMIVPYATSVSSEVIRMVPKELREAAYSLGATRWEVISGVVMPSARSGIVASYIMALGRALGETMAVTMLIGNSNRMPTGLFGPANTLASLIANEFGEAQGIKLSSLIALGLILFLITGLVNWTGKWLIKKIS